MNETASKTASCLSITEKRTTHRPGGCVGIFFQLFDWNRRLAKKKLFSKKLLPPARAKQVSKKFGGDEKMPKTKLHLIADENSGGFPNLKRNGKGSGSLDLEPKHEMRAPGLVARLMGLESMPTVQKDKPKKASIAACSNVREEGFLNQHGGSNREDLGSEKGNAKVESRPQKLQKTGQFERRAVTRFGAEALQIKGVLSRSRKHQHPRFASPVKSPRISSGRNMSRTSRLIDAATKILEPGLQATNRAKCAITYSSSMHYAVKDEVLTEERMGVMTPDLSKPSGCNVNVGKSLMGQTSCRNCGNLLDVVDSRTNMEEQPYNYSSSASNLVNFSSPGLGKSKPSSPILPVDKERDENFKQHNQPISLAVPEKDDNRLRSVCDKTSPVRKIPCEEGQDQCHLSSRQCKPQKEEPSFTFNQRTQTQNWMSLGRDRIPSRAKLTNLPSSRVSSAANTDSGAKDFVALNRNLSGRTRPRVPASNSTLDPERKSGNLRDDSLAQLRTPVRKRRTISVNGQVQSTDVVNTTRRRHRNVTSGKQVGLNAQSMNQTPIKCRAAGQGDGNRANGNKDSDVISFTFTSPLRHKSGISTEIKEKLEDHNFLSKSTSYRRKAMDESDGASSLRKQLPLCGDALGALLQEKLKELTSQEEDELMTAATPPKRSTAMILQELISALTTEQPISCDADVFRTDTLFQTKANAKGTSVGFVCDGNHLSPGSVLEASFSNDSCLSSSFDDTSVTGHRLHLDSIDNSQVQPQPAEPDADLLDSATSISKGSTGHQMVNDLVSQISRLLLGVDRAGLGLTGTKLTHVKDVILNAELLFGNTSPQNSDGIKDFLIAPFLLDELEVLATAMWPKFNCLLGFEVSKDGNQLQGFLFDCLIEFFNTKYSRYCNSGFKAWTRLPLHTKAEMLIREVGEEVIRWTNIAGMTPDEIIECDMSYSLRKWTDFHIEAFQTGAEIGWDILQILVEEIVTDIYQVQNGSQFASFCS